jgi:hypothetical protein
MITVDLNTAEQLAVKNDSLTWDGWTLVHHKPYKMGWARKDGEWHHTERRWYIAQRYSLQSNGLYKIPKTVYHGLQH